MEKFSDKLGPFGKALNPGALLAQALLQSYKRGQGLWQLSFHVIHGSNIQWPCLGAARRGNKLIQGKLEALARSES